LDFVNYSREVALGTHGLTDHMMVRLVRNERIGGPANFGTNA